MLNWRSHLRIRRLTVALAVAAVVAPTAQARIANPDFDTKTSQVTYPAGITTQDPKSLEPVLGMVRPGESDYARYPAFAQDKIELVRLQPRSTVHSLDGVELVRLAPRTTQAPDVVSSPGFDWGDAAIGASLVVALGLLGLGAAMATRQVKPVGA